MVTAWAACFSQETVVLEEARFPQLWNHSEMDAVTDGKFWLLQIYIYESSILITFHGDRKPDPCCTYELLSIQIYFSLMPLVYVNRN